MIFTSAQQKNCSAGSRWTKHVDAYVMERRAIKGCEFTSH